MSNKNLNRTKNEDLPDRDEYYTLYEEAVIGLTPYRKHLEGKKVLCPCRDLRGAFDRLLTEWGVNHVCPAVDFERTVHNTDADVIVTNPPFKKLPAFMKAIEDSGKDFVLILPTTWQTRGGLNRFWENGTAFESRSLSCTFCRPNGNLQNVPITWVSSFNVDGDKPKNKWYKYSLDEVLQQGRGWFLNHPTTGEEILHLKRGEYYPNDYFGLVGVPLSSGLAVCGPEFKRYPIAHYHSKKGQKNPFVRMVVSRVKES